MTGSAAQRIAMALVLALLLGVGSVIAWLHWQDRHGASATTIASPAVTQALSEVVTVPEDGACPGFSFASPAPSRFAPQPASADGSRSLATVPLDDDGSAFLVVCLGSVQDRGSPHEAAEAAAAGMPTGLTTEPARVERRDPFGDMVRLDTAFGSGKRLSDWYVERQGALFVVGYLRSVDGADVVRESDVVVEQMLASWRWS